MPHEGKRKGGLASHEKARVALSKSFLHGVASVGAQLFKSMTTVSDLVMQSNAPRHDPLFLVDGDELGVPTTLSGSHKRRRREKNPFWMYDGTPKPPNPRRKDDLDRKLRNGDRHPAQVVSSCADIGQPHATKSGWAGQDYSRRADSEKIMEAWLNRTIVTIMLKDMFFKRVPFEDVPVIFTDVQGYAFGYRSELPEFVVREDESGVTFLFRLGQECTEYMLICRDRSLKDIMANNRGLHWYMVVGVDRQIKKEPDLTQFHKQHEAETERLILGPDCCARRVANFASDVLRLHFPSLAQRVEDCEEKLRRRGCKYSKPPFGLFYNFCINGPREGVLGVSTKPHVDGKNLALMVCALFVWGTFDSKEKAWLVLWEAGLIIEIPAGVLMLYPSSLFTHFNVDMSDLHIVTTADGSRPTRTNSSPLDGVAGRGSIVLFNQVSLFQLAELGYTVKEAREQGMSTTCDNTEYISSLPVPSS